jgi:hypothetical protein
LQDQRAEPGDEEKEEDETIDRAQCVARFAYVGFAEETI